MTLLDSSPSTADIDAYGPQGRSPWLDIDWREHQSWVTVAGRPVNVIDMGPRGGDLSPLVFIHGLSGCWQNWLENMPVFAAERRVVALDLPGFGRSPMPAEKISITGYARIVDELLETLGIAAACVVGNSMGGFTAAELAIRSPQRVERLVLVSAAGISVSEMRNDPALAVMVRTERVLTMISGLVAARAAKIARRPRLRKLAMAAVATHPDLLPGPFMSEQIAASSAPGFVSGLDALTGYEFEDRLPEIACPTLIYWGAKDMLVPVRDSKRFEELIPDSRRIVLEDTGHCAMFERPARFNRDLAEFLAEPPNDEIPSRG